MVMFFIEYLKPSDEYFNRLNNLNGAIEDNFSTMFGLTPTFGTSYLDQQHAIMYTFYVGF